LGLVKRCDRDYFQTIYTAQNSARARALDCPRARKCNQELHLLKIDFSISTIHSLTPQAKCLFLSLPLNRW
jgi:hypothetical protein